MALPIFRRLMPCCVCRPVSFLAASQWDRFGTRGASVTKTVDRKDVETARTLNDMKYALLAAGQARSAMKCIISRTISSRLVGKTNSAACLLITGRQASSEASVLPYMQMRSMPCSFQRSVSASVLSVSQPHSFTPIRCFASGKLPQHRKVPLPALSPTMEMGTIVSWKKKEGDQLSEGDLLCEIETDKATMGFEASEEGYLAKILVPEGTKDVPIGRLLCIVVENKDDVPAFSDFVDEAPIAAKSEEAKPEAVTPPPLPPPAPTPAPAPSVSAPLLPPQVTVPSAGVAPPAPRAYSTPLAGGRILVSPFARKIAEAKKLDLSTIKGTGPGGRILAEDVEAAAAAGPMPAAAAPEAFATISLPSAPSFIDIPLSNMRRTIAKRLVLSKQTIPHYYVSVEVKMDEIFKLREKLNNMLKKSNKKLSVNDFIIKAAALSCMRVPEANSFWMDTFIRQNNIVDMSVAVSTDAGLITPIIFGANLKGLLEISDQMKALAEKARAGTLQPNEFQGGTFTVSNLGMFGVDNFSAIINPPQSAILAIGGVRKQLIPDPDKGFVEMNIMKVTLSCDHRVIDGAVGAKWASCFRNFMEKPHTMLL